MARRRRRRAPLKKTVLCAVKFWSGTGSPGHPLYKKRTATLRSGVRHVARKQGYSTSEIERAERELERDGLIIRRGKGTGATLKTTPKGSRQSCKSVKLAPWTDEQYPGSQLEGTRRKRRCKFGRSKRTGKCLKRRRRT